MAGEPYIGTDESGRPRYRNADGQMMPAGWRPSSRPRSTVSTIRSQLSTGSQSTIAGRLGSAVSGAVGGVARTAQRNVDPGVSATAGRGVRAVRGVGGLLGGVNSEIEGGMRANPYGGQIGEDAAAGGRRTGFEGYYGESEFVDPMGQQRFYAGDARTILDGMDPAVVARVQNRLKRLGFIEGNYAEGAVLPETVGAFEDLLSESNRRGTTWGRTLADLEQMYEDLGIEFDGEGAGRGEGPAPFTAPAYLAPDYATLAQGVKAQMRQALGRDPDESEIAQLTAELDGWYRSAYDEEVEAARREYEMQVSGEGGTPEPGRQIDPQARFKEMFESRYAPGIKNEQMKAEVEGQQGLVQGAVSTLSQMAGGRG